MLKAHWKLEWNAHRYIFFATFVGWLICLLIGLFSKLGNGLLEPLVMDSDIDVVVFASGDGVFIALIGFVGASWILIWLLLFLAAARSGIYDENRYLFFQTETPIWKILLNKLIIVLIETAILTAGVLVIIINLAIIGGAEMSFSVGLNIIFDTFLAMGLNTFSLACIIFLATALSMVPVNGFRVGFIGALIYFVIINAIQISIGTDFLPKSSTEIHFYYSLFSSVHFNFIQMGFNLLMALVYFFLATKILNKSADLQ
ncbi:TPA_asm: hypothetical protein GGB32_13980 [Listeria monocytogenes]|nr:hypothetical protein [Listeria monocytogenes]